MSSIRALFGKGKKLGLGETEIRDLTERVTGKTSLKGHSPQTYDAILDQMGDAPDAPRQDNNPKLNKARALWIAGYNLGIIGDRRDTAMFAFIKRQTGIDHVNWVQSAEDYKRVIEALKNWLHREGFVDWKLPFPEYPNHEDQARVTLAIFRGKNKYRSVHERGPSDPRHNMNCYLAKVGDQPTTRQWYSIQNKMGQQLREMKEQRNGIA